MDIRPILNEEDLTWALKEIEPYFENDPVPGSPDDQRFDVLATLIEAYEAKHHLAPPLHPVDAIEARMIDKPMTRRQLCAATGITESNLSEVLARKRALSLGMIRAIGPLLDLPTEVLVRPYPIARRAAVKA